MVYLSDDDFFDLVSDNGDMGDDVLSMDSLSLEPSKRRHLRRATRDSFGKRTSPGRPGTKRHQRYLNHVFLAERVEELEPRDWEIREPSGPSPLARLMHSADGQRFVDMSEEQESQLLSSLRPQAQPRKENSPELPVVAFERISRKSQRVLRRQGNETMVKAFDAEIRRHLSSDRRAWSISCSDSLQRLVCHGVCEFYALISFSVDTMSTRRVLVRKNARNSALPLPRLSLSEFLFL